MRFWDSSAIVPLVIAESESEYCLNALSADQNMLVWCLSRVEVLSGLCRRLREEIVNEKSFEQAKSRLRIILESAFEVKAIENVRSRAARLLEVHPLRAADACQLAAALVGTQEDPGRLPMICFDRRLAEAARKEGFQVNPAA
jgi:predicted nucleic acid-binding protein